MSFYLIVIKKETLKICFFLRRKYAKTLFDLIAIKKETLEIRFF